MKTNVEIMSRKAMNVLIESGFPTTIISEKYGVTIRTAQRWKESFESFVEDFLKKF